MPPEEQVVLVDGPWTHRDVTANGARFHVAEAGPLDGPLVLLLHGFPEFWWSWRHQLAALADEGFRVVAPDLRGYGASDKPPRGYDGYTLSSDVAGMIRALGARSAHLVGHDWGGLLAWAVATLHPGIARTLSILDMPHPVRLRQALLTDPAQLRASAYIGFFQLPKAPEARLVKDDGAYVGQLLHGWGGPGFPDAETEARCREAVQIPGVAHSSLEWYRWAIRSLTRPSGLRFLKLLERGVQVPVLQLHGALDTCLLPSTAHGSGAWARGGYELQVLDGVGHFPHQEVPDVVSAALVAHARA
ncbi:MAG: alpha/beta hydrolase [Actinobacteria bacterium]|nr:alpha/beta hydrolase [Actinomycetota bacterium]MCA1721377.1 alpha/beta hydrolase [Actinomycetota bacterium]